MCTSTRGTGTSCEVSGTRSLPIPRLIQLEKRCSALKSENDRIRRELQKLQKMRNDVRRRAASYPDRWCCTSIKPEDIR